MSQPLVSVVLPVKNGERFLAGAIQSVLAQDYRPWELIVVDGHSTDRSASIAASFRDVRIVQQTEPGIPQAYNYGIQLARGSLVAFNSADDLWEPHKLRRQVEHLAGRPEEFAVVSLFRYLVELEQSWPRGFNPALLNRDLVGRLPETLLARREAFCRVGGFGTEYGAGHDTDWFARFKDAGLRLGLVSEVLVHKRLHNQNTTLADTAEGVSACLRVVRASIRRQRDCGSRCGGVT